MSDQKPGVGMIVRDQFQGSEIVQGQAETSAVAVAETARALVEARYVMAMRRPRDMDDVRVKLLKECSRPRFAEGARYSKPRGGKQIEGPSIRFAEAAARVMGNIAVQTPTVFEDTYKRIVRVSVTDLESNFAIETECTIDKTIERRQLRDKEEPISVRTNAQGKAVYIVAASDDDLRNKEKAIVSKELRNSILRILPTDIRDECMDVVVETLKKQDKSDPDAARKRLIDSFAKLNVTPSDLKDLLGHDLDKTSPAEMDDLRTLFTGLRDGEVTWAEVIAERDKRKGEAASGGGGGRVSSLKEQLAKKANATKAQTGGEEEPPPPEAP